MLNGGARLRKIVCFIVVSCLIALTGCSQEEDATQWYDTKEKAIHYRLKQEGTNETAILSIEDFKGETIVFYEFERALGVASITESEEGFSWYRNRAYSGFEGDSPYSTVGFEFETETGLNVPILAGKASDISIEKIQLKGDGLERDLRIFDTSRLFFSIHEAPFSLLEVIPIKAN